MNSAAASRIKFSGYVGHDEYEQRVQQMASAASAMRRSSSALFLSESSMESFGQQSCSTASFVQSTENLSQLSSQSGNSSNYQQHLHNNNTVSATKPVLTNSSSKSNSKSSVLRENYDTDQRQKSGQKTMFGFSGKDQKNVSPYSDKVRNSLNKKLLMSTNKLNANIMKAKRQISFDSWIIDWGVSIYYCFFFCVDYISTHIFVLTWTFAASRLASSYLIQYYALVKWIFFIQKLFCPSENVNTNIGTYF